MRKSNNRSNRNSDERVEFNRDNYSNGRKGGSRNSRGGSRGGSRGSNRGGSDRRGSGRDKPFDKEKYTNRGNKDRSSRRDRSDKGRNDRNRNDGNKSRDNSGFDKRSSSGKSGFSQSIEKVPNLIIEKKRIYTKNLNPKTKVYDERLITVNGDEYREWDPNKSKFGAAIFNGLNNVSLREDTDLLYLGSSTGTTVSHLSDIITQGRIFALDFAPRVHRELLFLCENRKNIYPLLADVTSPSGYKQYIPQVDFIFQDVAQKNQLIPFIKNIKLFLKPNGIAMISVKARSIDVTKRPSEVFKDFSQELEKHVNLMEKRLLDPYEKDHCLFVVKQKKK